MQQYFEIQIESSIDFCTVYYVKLTVGSNLEKFLEFTVRGTTHPAYPGMENLVFVRYYNDSKQLPVFREIYDNLAQI